MKNPYAVALGRLGGKTTGPTKARDPEKMRQAAFKRWKNYLANKLSTAEIPESAITFKGMPKRLTTPPTRNVSHISVPIIRKPLLKPSGRL